MKKISYFLLIILISLIFTSCNIDIVDDGNDDEFEEDVIKYVNVLEINDTHGATFTDDSMVGLDKVQSVIESIEKDNGEYIKVANGDIFQGAYVSNQTHGKVFIDLLNKMDFDCFVIGNHEFDWGLEEIAKYKDGDESNGELNCPFIACNLIDKRTSSRPEWIDEYVIVENNGCKVGIIGAIGERLESSIAALRIENYEFVNPDNRIKQLAETLRVEEKCDVVIVSIHEYEISHNETLASFDGNQKIDGVICGHTHQKINDTETRKDGYTMPVVQSYTKNGVVGTLRFKVFNHQAITASIKHYTPSNYPTSTLFDDIKLTYKDLIEKGNLPLFIADEFLSKEILGRMATSSMCTVLGADVGCMNEAGVRTTIPKGSVHEKDLLEAFPFDNEIYLVEISGSKLKSLLSRSGLYITSNLEDISDSKTYKLAIIDYVFTSSYYTKLFQDTKYSKTGRYIRDVIIEEYQK